MTAPRIEPHFGDDALVNTTLDVPPPPADVFQVAPAEPLPASTGGGQAAHLIAAAGAGLHEALNSLFDDIEATLSEPLSEPNARHTLAQLFDQLWGALFIAQIEGAQDAARDAKLVIEYWDRLGDEQRATETLADVVLQLRRYLNLLYAAGLAPMPALMLEPINSLRLLLGKPALPEFQLTLGDFDLQLPPLLAPDPSAAPELWRHLRQMFEVGLIGVLRSDRLEASSALMERACTRAAEHHAEATLGRLLWEFAAVWTHLVGREQLEMTLQRKQLLAALDRELRAEYTAPTHQSREATLSKLIREMGFLVRLSGHSSTQTNALFGGCAIPTLAFRETDLLRGRLQLKGPDTATISALVAAMREELEEFNRTLESASEMVDPQAQRQALATSLNTHRETLELAKLTEPAAQAGRVLDCLQKPNTLVQAELLEALAVEMLRLDQLLQAATAPKHPRGTDAPAPMLADAKQALGAEARAALSLCRRGIEAFHETGDALHLGNLGAVMRQVQAAILFLGREQLHAPVRALTNALAEDLQADAVGQERIALIVDAMVTCDYLLSIPVETPLDATVLELAESTTQSLLQK